MLTTFAETTAADEDRCLCERGNFFHFRYQLKQTLKQNEPEITVSWGKLARVTHSVAYCSSIIAERQLLL